MTQKTKPKKKNKPKTTQHPAPPQNSGEQTTDARHIDILCWITLFILGGLLYGHTLNAPWYLDDLPNIVNNSKIHDLPKALDFAFYGRGIAYLSFALNYSLSGLSLPGFHATNILIHILCSGLAYLVAKRVFPKQPLYAALVALIFLVHPLQTQAVTYIVQRMASMAAFFGFLSLYLYIRARERLDSGVKWSDLRHLGFWSMALISCYLAVKTKENLAILPLVMLLFDYAYLSSDNRKQRGLPAKFIYFAPFFLPPLNVALKKLLLPLSDGVTLQTIASVQEAGITPLQYLVTEFNVIWIYLRLLIVPYPQMLDYAYPVAKTLLTVQNVIAGAGLVALATAAFLVRKRYPHLSFGLYWFLIGLAVESTLIPLDPVFEHRLYLSMFGFAVFVVGAGHYFLSRRILLPLALCCLLSWSILSWNRNQMWNDELVLYQDNARHITPDDGFNIALSKILLMRELYPEAIAVLTPAVEGGAKKVGIYTNLGIAYRLNKQPDKAIEVFTAAFAKGIKNTDSRIELARAYHLAKNYKKAAEVFRDALKNGREIDLITKELGLTLASDGQFVEAEPYLQHTLDRMPGNSLLLLLIAQAKMNTGDFPTAETLLRQAVATEPGMTNAWFMLGLAGDKAGNKATRDEALQRLYQIDSELAARLEKLTLK